MSQGIPEADVGQILRLHGMHVSDLEISVQLSIPVTVVRTVTTAHKLTRRSIDAEPKPAAAARDERLEQLLSRAAKSGHQRTRTLGERLRALRDDLRARLAAEDRRRELGERVQQLKGLLTTAQRELRDQTSKESK